MKTEKKILKFREIMIEDRFYPRLFTDEETVERYSLLMKEGVVFPDIVVALLNNKYYLVDGLHRMEAKQTNGEVYDSFDVLSGLNEKEIYLEAIKRNLEHGRPLETSDLKQIKITLEEWNMSQEEIKSILRVDLNKLSRPVADSMNRIGSNNSGMPVDKAFEGFDQIINNEEDSIFNKSVQKTESEDTLKLISFVDGITAFNSKMARFSIFMKEYSHIKKESFEGKEVRDSLYKVQDALRQIEMIINIKGELLKIKHTLEKSLTKH